MFQKSHLFWGVLLEGDDVAVAVVAPDAVSEDAVARTVASSPAARNFTGIPVIVADDSDNAGGGYNFPVGGFDVLQAEGPQLACPVYRDDPLKG